MNAAFRGPRQSTHCPPQVLTTSGGIPQERANGLQASFVMSCPWHNQLWTYRPSASVNYGSQGTWPDQTKHVVRARHARMVRHTRNQGDGPLPQILGESNLHGNLRAIGAIPRQGRQDGNGSSTVFTLMMPTAGSMRRRTRATGM